MDPMTKMWVSFIAIGLMAVSALLATFAKTKTTGWVKLIIMIIAFVLLLLALLYGIVSII